ncbi:hypothetical protein RSOLAG22IIIB_12329 [Rhizoctonia solani]|uniref:Ricin B lectin domain-containing protein n=1 Tax=Rhizoctonia solani TaxID=456999 RepID=A0A0K6GDP2_9AGAM|nr:hypothetical protein RSOLAG22IIIB_12329 [Rhizoctonia solani]
MRHINRLDLSASRPVKFNMTVDPGTYIIKNAAFSTNASVSTVSDGVRNVHGWQQISNNITQQWVVKSVGDVPNSYYLQNKDHGLYLYAASPASGTNLIGSNAVSFWTLNQQADGLVEIVYPGSTFVADLANAADGTPITLVARNNTSRQKWTFTKVGF